MADRVVCPECGAPHHRECYNKNGGCAFTAQHGPGCRYNAGPDQTSEPGGHEQQRAQGAAFPCRVCGAPVPSDSLFCPRCGSPTNAQVFHSESGTPFGASPFGQRAGAAIDPHKELEDGVTVEEAAAYVKTSQTYYLPKFVAFSETKNKLSFSLAGFFFPSLYFFYRKMWATGVLVYLGYLLLNLHLFAGVISAYITEMQLGAVPAFLEKLANPSQAVYLTMSLLLLALCIVCGLFANYWYYRHVLRAVKKEKMDTTSPFPVVTRLQSKGGATVAPVIIIMFGFSFLLSALTLVLSQFL